MLRHYSLPNSHEGGRVSSKTGRPYLAGYSESTEKLTPAGWRSQRAAVARSIGPANDFIPYHHASRMTVFPRLGRTSLAGGAHCQRVYPEQIPPQKAGLTDLSDITTRRAHRFI